MSRPIPKPRFLTPELVLRAYAAGIFPMAESRDDPGIFWVDPKIRGVLPLESFHVSRSLRKKVRRNVFEIRCDTAFDRVIDGCGGSYKGRNDTWINDEIAGAYSELHALGFVHSVECWQNDMLVGGLYGVSLAGGFFGESMFSRVPDASKVALVHLVARLNLGGYVLLDTQFVTDHLKGFGAVEIPARRYLELLEEALKVKAEFYPDPPGDELEGALEALFRQSRTQTS
ncbi:MAG: leucyl/phenylalanyl-tRNA--protein transferase [Rhodospirillales bacterium]